MPAQQSSCLFLFPIPTSLRPPFLSHKTLWKFPGTKPALLQSRAQQFRQCGSVCSLPPFSPFSHKQNPAGKRKDTLTSCPSSKRSCSAETKHKPHKLISPSLLVESPLQFHLCFRRTMSFNKWNKPIFQAYFFPLANRHHRSLYWLK